MADSLLGLGTNTSLWRVSPNWQNQVEHIRKILANVVAAPGALAVRNAIVTYPPKAWKFLFTADRVDMYNFILFVADRMGRFKAFWFPEIFELFTLVTPIALNDTIINVHENCLWNEKERLFIELTNGDYISRTISSCVYTSYTAITINEPMDRDIAIADVLRIGFLNKVRLENDALDIAMKNSNLFSCDVALIELLNEYEL